MADYGILDRIQHRLALQFTPLAELSFDLDQRLARAAPGAVAQGDHVFVSGLARAGTTILMRRLYESGCFRSLTYRDMPFVLAPNLWRRISGSDQTEARSLQRAHGDRLQVDVDSPEGLDEVFWRIFSGDDYIRADRLSPHRPDAETLDRFVRYVNAILMAQDPGGPKRYLSKNNNNILRLPAIRATFPNATILVPFRNPIDHAASLMRQHENFSRMQQRDGFVQSYMTWLAHHEFGIAHRPFRLSSSRPVTASPSDLGYWIEVWRDAYRWLEQSAPEDVTFVCYEDLCADPQVWQRIAEAVNIPAHRPGASGFVASTQNMPEAGNSDTLQEATEIYLRLRQRVAPELGSGELR